MTRFWVAYNELDWSPDGGWKAGGKFIPILTGERIKQNFDVIARESDVKLMADFKTVDLLGDIDSGYGVTHRAAVTLSMYLRDLRTGETLDEWTAYGIGEDKGAHLTGSAYGMAYRNGAIFHFGLAGGQEDNEDIIATPIAPHAPYDTLERKKLDEKACEVLTGAGCEVTADLPLTPETYAKAKAISSELIQKSAFRGKTQKAYTDAVFSKSESKMCAWIEEYGAGI